MKTLSVRKSYDFSHGSRVILHIGTKTLHIKGFGSYFFNIELGEDFYASHLWTQSNKIRYDRNDIADSYLIRPRLDKKLAFIILVVFVCCSVIFLFIKNFWALVPFVPFVIYVLLYLTILKNKYLIIIPDNKEKEEETFYE